ncbi:hypothetical protein OBK20_11940 [Empedobacter falsenii]|uniref:hypothetical protein n=1 Tax=Empedobacter stercoris TaxID=1628248 RepID=UPI0039E78019
MKKTLFTLLLSSSLFAQEKATDLVGLSLNFMGFGAQYEKAINDNFTGQATVEYMGVFYSVGHVLDFDLKGLYTLKLSLEGRYYYNFDKRISNGKNTKNNSANYLAFKGSIYPDWLTTTNDDGKTLEKRGIVAFNYGIRRSFNKNLFFEFYGGPGIIFTQEKILNTSYLSENKERHEAYYNINSSETSIDVGFRIGYNF